MRKKFLATPLLVIIIFIFLGVGVVGAAVYFGGSGGTGEVNLQKGLVGWWKMDGNAKDSTPYGNNGTPNSCPAGHTNNGNGTCTVTFNPDANPETTSVDGYLYRDLGAGGTWANARDGAGTYAGDSITSAYVSDLWRGNSTSNWGGIVRAIFLFDTSSLPDNATITAATISLYGVDNKADPAGWLPDVNVYASTPASNTSLAAADYQQIGTTAYSTAITYNGFNSTGYNDFVLNASGITAISLTGVSKFGTRNANYDVANVEPTGGAAGAEARLMVYTSEQGAGYKPKLAVTYTPAAATGTFTTDRKGQVNKAYSFNGTTDFITIPDSNNWNFGSGDFTIGAWVNFTSNGDHVLVSQYGDAGANGAFAFAHYSNNALYFLWSTTGSSELSISGSWSPSVGTWYYVTAVRSGTSIKTYVNNAVVGSGTLSGTIYNSTRNLNIGAYRDGGQLFNGKMSDVRIYNRALSAAELTASYESYNSGIQVSDLQKGLVGNWKMDGNAKDSTPYGNNGTLTGTTLTTDRKGTANKAYSFNGTSDYITIANESNFDALLDGQHPFSVSWWSNASGVGASRIIFSKGNDPQTTAIYRSTSNGYSFHIKNTATYQTYVYPSAENETAGVWIHWVYTYDGSGAAAGVKHYKNGAIQTLTVNTDTLGATTQLNDVALKIGTIVTPAWYFGGSMDDVRIYNRALSQTEITALYQSYDPGIVVSTLQKGLVGNWKMDGNAKDSTPYGNNGTLTGTTLTTDRKGQANKAYSFNGTSDYMTFSGVLNTAGTISLWVKWLRSSVGYGAQDFIANFIFQHSANNYFYTRTWSGAYSYFAYAIPLDTWTHIVFTWTNSSDLSTSKLYANNVVYDPNPGGGGYGSIAGISGLANGGAWGGNYLNAVMNDVRVYNRALSAAEITALYQSY